MRIIVSSTVNKSASGVDDSSHEEAREETGYWGRRGAGCLVFAEDTGRFLIAHRSENVMEPHTFGTWGGAIDEREDPKSAMFRELYEESGYNARAAKVIPLNQFKDHRVGFVYHNFVVVVSREFDPPKLDERETQGFVWSTLDALPSPLHPGLSWLLNQPKSKLILSNLVKASLG